MKSETAVSCTFQTFSFRLEKEARKLILSRKLKQFEDKAGCGGIDGCRITMEQDSETNLLRQQHWWEHKRFQ